MTFEAGRIYPQAVNGRYRSIKNRVNYLLLFIYFLVLGSDGIEE